MDKKGNFERLRNKLKSDLFQDDSHYKQKVQEIISQCPQILEYVHCARQCEFKEEAPKILDYLSNKRQLEQMKQSFKNLYQIGKILVEGAHAVVRQCWQISNPDETYAVKITRNPDPEITEIMKQTFLNTVSLNHPYICMFEFSEKNVEHFQVLFHFQVFFTKGLIIIVNFILTKSNVAKAQKIQKKTSGQHLQYLDPSTDPYGYKESKRRTKNERKGLSFASNLMKFTFKEENILQEFDKQFQQCQRNEENLQPKLSQQQYWILNKNIMQNHQILFLNYLIMYKKHVNYQLKIFKKSTKHISQSNQNNYEIILLFIFLLIIIQYIFGTFIKRNYYYYDYNYYYLLFQLLLTCHFKTYR